MSEQTEHELRLAAFNQTHEGFRSLNQQMWQIPLIAMTLTGGLWFGVSSVENFPLFQLALLFLAAAGNIALFVVLLRLRFVMEQHLNWLKANHPAAFISAKGEQWYNKPFVVRTAFQTMLLLAAVLSVALLIVTAWQVNWKEVLQPMPNDPSVAYYDKHAANLADGYEMLSLEAAHPALLNILNQQFEGRKLSALDVGAGTGRDAAWFASKGHRVVAVEPSLAMQQIGRRLHPTPDIEWRLDRLPDLEQIVASGDRFDVVVLSAVWMHVQPEDRDTALSAVSGLLNQDGVIYLTLRIGPADAERGIFPVSVSEIERIAAGQNLSATKIDEQNDLLGRQEIRWTSVAISRNDQ